MSSPDLLEELGVGTRVGKRPDHRVGEAACVSRCRMPRPRSRPVRACVRQSAGRDPRRAAATRRAACRSASATPKPATSPSSQTSAAKSPGPVCESQPLATVCRLPARWAATSTIAPARWPGATTRSTVPGWSRKRLEQVAEGQQLDVETVPALRLRGDELVPLGREADGGEARPPRRRDLERARDRELVRALEPSGSTTSRSPRGWLCTRETRQAKSRSALTPSSAGSSGEETRIASALAVGVAGRVAAAGGRSASSPRRRRADGRRRCAARAAARPRRARARPRPSARARRRRPRGRPRPSCAGRVHWPLALSLVGGVTRAPAVGTPVVGADAALPLRRAHFSRLEVGVCGVQGRVSKILPPRRGESKSPRRT